jgi:hypothetical protein
MVIVFGKRTAGRVHCADDQLVSTVFFHVFSFSIVKGQKGGDAYCLYSSSNRELLPGPAPRGGARQKQPSPMRVLESSVT